MHISRLILWTKRFFSTFSGKQKVPEVFEATRGLPSKNKSRIGQHLLIILLFSVLVKWDDSLSQRIDDTVVLLELLNEIHDTLNKGQSVLVHCAQGKSRSATIAVAYISKFEGISVIEALRVIQAERAMAEPNLNFMQQLLDMEKAKVLKMEQ